MRAKLILGTLLVSAIAIVGFSSAQKSKGESLYMSLSLESVETISACESVGWLHNDGNCVKNSYSNEYFCKDDSWYEFTDCIR